MHTPRITLPGIIALLLASSLTIMVGCAITPALPSIGQHYGMGRFSGWLVTTPALGVIVYALTLGRLTDRIGPWKTAIAGLSAYGILGIAGPLMPGKITLLADRFLLGIATAAVMTASTALIARFWQGEKQLNMIALQGMAIEGGGVIFLFIGGLLAETGWQAPFAIYAVAFIALILSIRHIPRPADTGQDTADDTGTPAPRQHAWPVFALAFASMLTFFSAIVILPGHLQDNLGHSPAFTGGYLASLSLVAITAATLMPKVVARFGEHTALTLAFIAYGCAHLLFCTVENLPTLAAAALCIGTGFGFSIPLLASMTIACSPAGRRGTWLGYYAMATFSGQFLSSALITCLSGKTAFAAAALIAAATATAIRFIPRPTGKTRPA